MNCLDNFKLKQLYDLNIDKRPHKFEEITITDGKSGFMYILPEWLTGSPTHYVRGNLLSKDLKGRGYNIQLYYDVLILCISDISERPKCPCGKFTEFSSIPKGYKTFCNIECQVEYQLKGCKQSEETKMKRSEAMKGKQNALGYKHTDKAKRSMSEKRKGKKHSESWNLHLAESARSRYLRMPELMPSYGDTLRGTYLSNKSNGISLKYHSSWELDFMKLCDSIPEIVLIERHKVILPYHDPVSNKDRHYDPDFKVTLESGESIIVEIKPLNLVKDPVVQAKKMAAEDQIPKMGYRYVILTENELYGKDRLPILEYLK